MSWGVCWCSWGVGERVGWGEGWGGGLKGGWGEVKRELSRELRRELGRGVRRKRIIIMIRKLINGANLMRGIK